MICKMCGGNLGIKDGFYICDNCHNKMTISSVFENTEVFIAYVEADDYDRRTKDSILAQDIYNKLENSKINTFYQRISADGLSDNDYHSAHNSALDFAKIIIIIATNTDYFDKLINSYRSQFGGKKIIPVYSGINAYDMPIEIKNLQALNYDNVGAINDISKIALKYLNREAEIDFVAEVQKHISQKKKIILSVISVVIILVTSITSYIIFGTPYVLDSKKYEKAENLYETNQYIEALNLYLGLNDYRNSKSKVLDIYNKYSGYYKNDDNYSLRLSIDKDNKADIEFSYSEHEIINRSSGTFLFVGNIAEFQLINNSNEYCDGRIELQNDSIVIAVSEVGSSENKNNNRKILFLLKDKTDESLVPKITTEQLASWFSESRQESYFLNQGYRLENIKDPDKANMSGFKKIEDLEVRLAVFYELATSTDGIFLNYEQYDDGIVMGITSSADILIPNSIGKESKIFVSNNVLYAPNYNLWLMPSDLTNITLSQQDGNYANRIEADTAVAAIPKNWVSESNWNYLISEFCD